MNFLNYRFLLIIVAVLVFNTCSNTLSTITIKSHSDLVQFGNKVDTTLQLNSCNDPENYIPDAMFQLKHKPRQIRVNVHFMNSRKGDRNYRGDQAATFAWQLLDEANKRLRINAKMNLPKENKALVWPAFYEYKLHLSTQDQDDSGIYFHNDDRLFYYVNQGKNKNLSSRKLVRKYAIGLDSIVNIFMLPHHPDSIISKTYRANASGIALGNAIKLAIDYENKEGFWNYAGLLNHEMGHVMGLKHSWNQDDGCEDTPYHTNCWNVTSEGPCKDEASNNMMDYNVSQMAITPCQLGTIHRNFYRVNSRQRRIIEKTWCAYDSIPIVVDEKQAWYSKRDINQDIIVLQDMELTVHCHLSLASKASIILEPGATLRLFAPVSGNECGTDWNGITMLHKGKRRSKVVFTEGSVMLK